MIILAINHVINENSYDANKKINKIPTISF